jgi:hypothetical protein
VGVEAFDTNVVVRLLVRDDEVQAYEGVPQQILTLGGLGSLLRPTRFVGIGRDCLPGQGVKARDHLHRDALAVAGHGLTDDAPLTQLKGGNGYKNMARCERVT